MGIEIDKVSGNNIAQDLAAINKINAEIKKTEATKKNEQTDAIKNAKEQKKEDLEAHLDTYNKHKVSNSIEQQIKEQKAKIEELSKNLEGIRDEYNKTGKARDEARASRYKSERDLFKKEVSERGLKRLFYEWRMKHLQKKDDEEIRQTFNTYHEDYDTAAIERKLAEKDYDIADAEAFAAIRAHTNADIDYLTGLWSKQDAYWDLAKMQQRLMLAKHMEDFR